MTESLFGPGREFDLIRRFLPLPTHEAVIVGTGDDAAVLQHGWIIGTDVSVEHVHFRRDWLSPEEIGYRSAAVAISDLAAMAATPIAMLVSLVLPAADYETFAERIMGGIAQAARQFGTAVAGGDLARTDGPLCIDVVALGQAHQPVLRSGARPGDEVWVTGQLGGAARALQTWRDGGTPEPQLRARYAEPRPRVNEALWLAQHLELHALIDLSDGLASDAAHIAAASNVGIRLETAAVPVQSAPPVSALPAGPALPPEVRLALTGGDDYELCFTAPALSVQPVRFEFERTFGIPLSRVGAVVDARGIEIVNEQGAPVQEQLTGFDHFGSTA